MVGKEAAGETTTKHARHQESRPVRMVLCVSGTLRLEGGREGGAAAGFDGHLCKERGATAERDRVPHALHTPRQRTASTYHMASA